MAMDVWCPSHPWAPNRQRRFRKRIPRGRQILYWAKVRVDGAWTPPNWTPFKFRQYQKRKFARMLERS